jgi:hypothetical protein
MKTTRSFVPFFCLLLLAGLAACQQPKADPKDLTTYIEQIRQTGMSEGAQRELHTVADICCGAMIVEFIKDTVSGTYGRSYTSTLCPSPKADPAAFEKLQKEIKANSDREFHQLQILADADSSGFVSTGEASDFRMLVEFGYQAASISEQEHHNLQSTCKAMMISPSQFAETLTKYRLLEAKAKERDMRPLPKVAL